MQNSQYEVEILVHGKKIKEYNQYLDGEYKTFLEGKNGTEYAIRVKNHSNRKVLAVVAIDSINCVDGKVSNGYKGRGYIIPAYDSVTIKGYRESDSTVGAFKFTNKHNSYAKEKGMERNVGVIAVNLIAEKEAPKEIVKEIHHYHDHYIEPSYPKPYFGDQIWCGSTGDGISYNTLTTSNSNEQIVSNFVQIDNIKRKALGIENTVNFDLGSTWGNRVEDKITRKHFNKGDIVASFKLFYASRPALESMGVKFYNEKEIDWPQGFEGEYAKAPKNWRG
jgi:hypothetical protein